MAVVAFDPFQGQSLAMSRQLLVEIFDLLPSRTVLDRFASGTNPATLSPLVNPLSRALHNETGIGEDLDDLEFRTRFEPLECFVKRPQFGFVVAPHDSVAASEVMVIHDGDFRSSRAVKLITQFRWNDLRVTSTTLGLLIEEGVSVNAPTRMPGVHQVPSIAIDDGTTRHCFSSHALLSSRLTV
ncbi:hypothetical protein D3C87_1550500 [compost metagenome]